MSETKKKLSVFGFQIDVSDVPIVKAEERFNNYVLEDGTVLRVKGVATSMMRVEGQYLPDGNPIYIAVISPAIAVDSSPMKKEPDEKGKAVKPN
jgi:hypothetical protein